MTTTAELINNTTDHLTSSMVAMDAAINKLDLAAASWTATTWSAISSPAVGGYSGFAETDVAIKAALDTFDSALDAIMPPVLPGSPSLTAYTAPIWSDIAWTNLKNLLTNFTSDITNSDDVASVVTKLTSETDKLGVALYAADRERKQQALRDVFSAANSATGARGFSYPNSMTTALKLAGQQQYMFDLSQTSRDLIKLVFEWAKSNYQFSVERQITAHNADVDFNIRYAGALVQVYDTTVRAVLDEYRTKVVAVTAKMEQKIKEYALRLDVAKTNAGIKESEDRIEIAKYAEDVRQLLGNVEAAIKTAGENSRNKVQAAATTVSAAAAMASAASQIAIAIAPGP